MLHAACCMLIIFIAIDKMLAQKMQPNLQPKMPIVIGRDAQLRSLKRSQDLVMYPLAPPPPPLQCPLKLMLQIKLANYLTLIWKRKLFAGGKLLGTL